jgi:hypothetical protein
MLLQTNSYVVPKDRRSEHARLLRRFRQTLARLGCENFEVYEQVGANWNSDQSSGRFVQIMRFRDRRHQLAVQAAERNDPAGQALIAEFCDLINFPYQQEHGFFAVGFYTSVLPTAPMRLAGQERVAELSEEEIATVQASAAAAAAAAEVPPPDQQTYVGASSTNRDAGDAHSQEQHFPQYADPHPQPASFARETSVPEESVHAAAHEPDLQAAPAGMDDSGADGPATAEIDEEYVERELDEMVKSFGPAPTNGEAAHAQTDIQRPPLDREPAPADNGAPAEPTPQEQADDDSWAEELPSAHVPGDPANADDEKFADLLESHFGQASDPLPTHEPASGHETPAAGGSGIGSVLDGGLLDHDLDVPLPAELIDNSEEPEPSAPESHSHRHGNADRAE